MEELKTKICNKCGIEQDINNFKEHHMSKDGHRHTCYDCLGEKNPNKTRAEKRREDKPLKKKQKKLEKLKLSDEDRFLKKILTDFNSYLIYTYSYINLPNPTPLQTRIAKILGENPERLILQAARGVGKSWITAIYGTWRLLRNVDEKILIISGTATLAEKISKFMRTLFHDVPILNHLEPSKDDSDSVKAWNISGCKTAIETSVSALGIGGQIVGKRATLVIADDVEIPANSATQLMREKLTEQVKEFSNILIPDVPGSVIFLGTPQSMESIYSKLPYPMKILPAKVPSDLSIYNGNIDPWVMEQGEPGTPTEKVRFSEEELAIRLSEVGLGTFMLQYMLDTSLADSDRYPLKQADLIVMELDKEMAPVNVAYGKGKATIINELENVGFSGDYLHSPSWVDDRREKYDNIIMSIDPSGSGTDETAYVIVGIKNGFVFILDVGGTEDGYSDAALMMLALKAKEYNVKTIVPEKNMGSGMFAVLLEKTLRLVYKCNIEKDFVSKGQKELRIINNIEPLLRNHKLVINYDVVSNDINNATTGSSKSLIYSLLYQMTHITKEKQALVHDDRIDTLAIACEYVKDSVILDANELLKQAKKEEMEKWLQEKVYGAKKSLNCSFIRGRR